MNIKGALAQVTTITWKQAQDETERKKISASRKTSMLRRQRQKRVPKMATGGSKRDTVRYRDKDPAPLNPSMNMLSHQSARHVQHLSPAAFLGTVNHSCFTDDRLMCLQKL